MSRKVRFGLANTKYAVWDPNANEGKGGYGALKDWKGAVSLSLTREGGDSTDFYADNGVYFTFAGTNGGYSADLEMALVPDTVRVDLLGEIVDETSGVQFEVADAEPAQFALVTEMLTDSGSFAMAFYNCKASRIETSANTKSDSPEVDTETMSIRIATQEFDYKGESKPFVQGHIEKTSANAAQYSAFLQGVVVPTAAAA